MLQLTVSNITFNSFEVTATGLSSGISDLICEWYLNGEGEAYQQIDTSYTTQAYYSFSNLLSSTTYTVECKTSQQGQTVDEKVTIEVITKSSDQPGGGDSSQLIKPWTWDKSNGEASNSQTIDAKTALTEKGKVSNFNYLVWNDLVSKMNLYIEKWQEGVWDNTYLTLAKTKMTNLDKTLTSSRFKSLCWQIATWGGHSEFKDLIDSGNFDKGKEVKAQYFFDFVNALNTEIDYANNNS